MDRKIQKDKSSRYKKAITWAAGVVLLVAAVYFASAAGGKYKIDASRVRIAEVKQTTFDDVIAIQGTVEPERSFFLDAVEGGTVQEVFVKAGAMVEAGQPLLRLSNTQLMLDFMNREAQIVEQINNLRNTRMQMELNERSIREQVLDIDHQKANMESQFFIDTFLFAREAISKKDYEDSRRRYYYLDQKQKLLQNSLSKDEAYRATQIRRIDQSIEMMERNLLAIRENLENLTVKAPIAGQLTAFNAETGESKMKGENLGRIDVLDNYIVKAQVDEHYLSRVQVGQQATFTHNASQYELVVERVLPEVVNNVFTVEFVFEGTLTPDIRRGQTVGIRLALSNSVEAVVVPRGGFYSSSAGKWVYVVSIDENLASKRQVKMGRQNPDFIEVLEGLSPGEKIITSSYDTYDEYDEIVLE